MGGHAVEMGVGVGVQFGVVKIATLCGVALTGPIGWLIFGTGAVTAGIASYYASKWYKRRVCGGRLVAQRCASDSGDMLAWWAARGRNQVVFGRVYRDTIKPSIKCAVPSKSIDSFIGFYKNLLNNIFDFGEAINVSGYQISDFGLVLTYEHIKRTFITGLNTFY